jgi:hypothetical protein
MPSYQEPVPMTCPAVPRAMQRRLEREMKKKQKKVAKLKPSKHKAKLEGEISDTLLLLNPSLSRFLGQVPSADRVGKLMKTGRCRHPRAIDVKQMYHQSEVFARQLTEAEAVCENAEPTPSAPSPKPADPLPAKKSRLSPDEEAMSELEEILGALYRDIPSFPAL